MFRRIQRCFSRSERCIVLCGTGGAGSEKRAALNIYRNTLTYQLDKIRELFALELENPMIRCRYLYSLLLLEKIP